MMHAVCRRGVCSHCKTQTADTLMLCTISHGAALAQTVDMRLARTIAQQLPVMQMHAKLDILIQYSVIATTVWLLNALIQASWTYVDCEAAR